MTGKSEEEPGHCLHWTWCCKEVEGELGRQEWRPGASFPQNAGRASEVEGDPCWLHCATAIPQTIEQLTFQSAHQCTTTTLRDYVPPPPLLVACTSHLTSRTLLPRTLPQLRA